MSDISMCSGNNCPLKENCYRFLAAPNPYRQSYFTEPPFNKVIEDCDYFWDFGNYDASRKSKDVKKL